MTAAVEHLDAGLAAHALAAWRGFGELGRPGHASEDVIDAVLRTMNRAELELTIADLLLMISVLLDRYLGDDAEAFLVRWASQGLGG